MATIVNRHICLITSYLLEWSARTICLVTQLRSCFKLFITCYISTCGSLRGNNVNDLIKDADAGHDQMGSHEQAVNGLEAEAVSAKVAKLIVTIFNKTCNKNFYLMGYTVKPVLKVL